MTAYTHLIAIDRETGTLWGGVSIAAGIAALEADVAHNAAGNVGEYDAEIDDVRILTNDELWARCDVYSVVLSDDCDEAPAGSPDGAELVYSGHEMGWLPEERAAAYGEIYG